MAAAEKMKTRAVVRTPLNKRTRWRLERGVKSRNGEVGGVQRRETGRLEKSKYWLKGDAKRKDGDKASRARERTKQRSTLGERPIPGRRTCKKKGWKVEQQRGSKKRQETGSVVNVVRTDARTGQGGSG